jgi:glycosyltransferase involved in cell wall biosynthesis
MFCPRPQQAARSLLGLPEDAFVVLFAATSLGLRRKGLFLLAQALAAPLMSEKLCLLSLGNGLPDLNIPVPIKHLGKIQDELLLSCIYSAADVFVCPSLQDNLPNTVLEAMACGTPVVAFDVGGIPDMVRPGITGLLAPAGDPAALHDSIVELLQSPTKRAEMAAACRRVAIEEYGLESQARRYTQLYETALQRLASQHLPVPIAYSISGSA